MSFKFNFCRTCGAPAKDSWTGFYSPESGEKIMKSVCSKVECHTEHDYKDLPFTFKFWAPDYQCSRCGKVAWDTCYY